MEQGNQKQTHYRKVFKSDHLGVADLEDFAESGSNLIFTIARVQQEYGTRVAGKRIDANIAYFQENIKPMVLNAGNSKIVKDLAGSCFIENWVNIPVQLYIDPGAKLKGEVVGGVRISPNPVQMQKPDIGPGHPRWDQVKKAYLRDGNFNTVLERANVSPEHQQQIIEECKNG
jgi:hypothetical protein